MSAFEKLLYAMAHQLGQELKKRGIRLALAESCTGGVVSAAMTDVAGISEVFCGSAVTYRNETKAEWLGVSRDHLNHPQIGPVSPHVAEQMCQGVLKRTLEADLAGVITGHLGPNSPDGLDGIVFIAVSFRSDSVPTVQRRTVTDSEPPTHSLRYTRQREAGTFLLQALLSAVTRSNPAPL